MEGTGGRYQLRGLQQFKQEMKSRYTWRGKKRYSRDFDMRNKEFILKMMSEVIKDVEERERK